MTKIFHVSPFQSTTGTYVFRIDLRARKLHIVIVIVIVIDYTAGKDGLTATLTGLLTPPDQRQRDKIPAPPPLRLSPCAGPDPLAGVQALGERGHFPPRPQPPVHDLPPSKEVPPPR